ncbi:MAG: YebC/PmpR family DNA-binding transcriptional regulator, partial [Oscillospiraceae bacterium]|nr:YebC/PmpR family DNA-binding transcriptional regulator [Oscillospiraceae bacterium]
DFTMDEDEIEIETEPSEVGAVREALTAKGYNVISAEAMQIPSTYTTLTDEDAIRKMTLLLEHLEDNDDVQNVYHNWDMSESEDEE